MITVRCVYEAQVQALEATIAELEGTLQQQQAEASDAVEQWSARWSELDALKSELETNLETLANERDELAESLQSERENGGKEVLALIEAERDTERAEWEAEKNQMQARIDEQNESLMASSQNVTAAKEELAQTRSTAEQAVDAWKSKYILSYCCLRLSLRSSKHVQLSVSLVLFTKIEYQNWKIPLARLNRIWPIGVTKQLKRSLNGSRTVVQSKRGPKTLKMS